MNILFLCVGNSARSQIAEGLAKEMFPPDFNIKSAGSMPSGFVHEDAIKTMAEIDIDISNQKSKSIEDLEDKFIENLDYIITLCAEEICPAMLNDAKKINWPNPDPVIAEISSFQQEAIFRKTRKNIFTLLKKFFTNLDL